MTVKDLSVLEQSYVNFSNWIIYVTVKVGGNGMKGQSDFSNWIIYVTVKDI